MISGWQKTSLSRLASRISDGSHNPPRGVELSGFLMLSSKNVYDDKITLESPRYLSESEFNSEDRRTAIRPGDVLLTIVGTIGRSAVVSEELPAITLQRSVAVIRPDASVVDSRFLMYSLINSSDELNSKARGVAQKGIYLEALREFKLWHPTLPEQRRIVAILDEAFEAIAIAKANAEKNLRNARELFDSNLAQVFSRQSGLASSQPLVSLTEIDSPITYGVVKPGEEGDVAFIRGGDIAQGRVLVDQLRTIDASVSRQYRRTLLRGGELLISLVGQPGQVAVAPEDLKGANIARQVGLIRLNDQVDAEYVRYYLQSPLGQAALGAKQSGSVQQVINLGELREVLVPIPLLSMQRDTVRTLNALSSNVERLTDLLRSKVAVLDELKKSLLNQAFSGQLKAKDADKEISEVA